MKKWIAVLLVSLHVSLPAFAFTQSGAATTPIGDGNGNVRVVAPANAGENVHWVVLPGSPMTMPCAK